MRLMLRGSWVVLFLAAGCTDPGSDPELAHQPSAANEFRPRTVEGTVLTSSTPYAMAGVRFTTPAKPGFHTWEQLIGVKIPELRMQQNVLVVAPMPTGFVCSPTDSLQGCIDATPPGTALELRPGRYRVSSAVRINRSITVRTLGIPEDRARCGSPNALPCAVIEATPAFNESGGFVTSLTPNSGLRLDHLVVDGNRAQRLATPAAAQCRQGDNQYGVNADIGACDGCRITSSVFQNALCGTGLRVNNVDVVNSLFADNGVHTVGAIDLLWSDGLTVGRCDRSYVVNNEFRDNTDIDLIFGSGNHCVGQDNRIRHGSDPSKSAFVALSIFTWYTTGPYFGADFSFNDIDCAGQCGKGLSLGSDDAMGPYFTFVEGGSVHDNRIRGAHQGVSVDTARNVEFYDNIVSESGGLHSTSCGSFNMGAYDLSPESVLERSRDSVPDSAYAIRQWDWCTPNWPIVYPEVRTLYGDFDGNAVSDTLEIHPGDGGWYVSHGSQRWLWGLGSADLHIVGDFDGDDRDDLLIYEEGGHFWHAALSTGGSFTPVPYALSGEVLGPGACSLDVDLDGADEVVNEAAGRCAEYDPAARRFVPANCPFSCDTPLNPYGHPATSSRLLYGYFDTDPIQQRRDALFIDPVAMAWDVKRGRTPWFHHYENWDRTLVGDFNGDAREDVLLVLSAQARWHVAQSLGDRFWYRQDALTGYAPYGILCARNYDQDPATEIVMHAAPTHLCADFVDAIGRFTVTSCSRSCFVH
jgi:hypothetical protein